MTHAQELIALCVGGCTLLAFAVAWVRWARPRYRALKHDATASRDVLLGRPAITDSITGREISASLPGIGKRVETVEQAVLQLADQSRTLTDHEQRLTALEDSRIERVVNQAESAAMWAAIGNEQDADDGAEE